ncbi:MAG: class I SAM-dependent methyltransferase [Candidatus Pacebacteria bacterium]|nr:class I SAM-dependent methyltransferase [Candidatus Paceibacterota bacterium]
MSDKRPKLPGEVRKPERINFGYDWEQVTGSEAQAAEYWRALNTAFTEAGIEFPKTGKVLELGTGGGLFLEHLLKEGVDAVGVDIRPRHQGNMPVARARIEELPFANNQFRLAVSTMIFDERFYTQQVHKMLAEIDRVIEPGGFYAAREAHLNKYLQPSYLTRIVRPLTQHEFALYRKDT